MSTLRLAAFFFSALALSACSGANLPLNRSNDSGPNPNNDAGPIPGPDGGPETCAAAGGQCVAITPSSCQNGTWGDANQYSCGSGVGVGCCLKHAPPADGGPEPTCASIGGTCTGVGQCSAGMGHLGPQTSDCTSAETVCCIPESACGGAENMTCCSGGATFRPICPSATSSALQCLPGMSVCDGGPPNDGGPEPTCASLGGTCTPGPSSGGCAVGTGHLGPPTSDCVGESVCCIPESACGGAEDVACCSGSGGPVRPTCDSASSTHFTCGSPYTLCDGGAGNACQAAGGQCVALTPSGCQNGTWGDANQYSCGGGLGVGCCLPGAADAGHD